MSAYRYLTNREFLSLADHQLDELTSTEIEQELVRRLGDLVEFEPLIELLNEHDIDADRLEILCNLSDAIADNSTVFNQLAALATETSQE